MAIPSKRQRLEVWAGIEGTVNRVGDRYFDQLVRNGHDRRDSDLDCIADLGVRTVRYPVLWERTAPDPSGIADWRWLDRRLHGLRARGINPIAGLVHHGSGPRHTSLVDPRFPELLARYAGAVAERYPWLTDYTPVNEPLTTARFSGMYGHWYPHGRDHGMFLRCLLTECKATTLAMQAIRAVTPGARLIFTEDLGYVRSTPKLAYQAAFENHRRWLSIELVCGRVDDTHPLRSYMLESGVTERELAWFLEHPCTPDIVGFNYYITSERYLDHEMMAWPVDYHGGNHRHTYADVESWRSCGVAGIGHLLAHAWERLGLPLAITEVHLGSTREQQLRWLLDTYLEAEEARASGIDLRAVTAWSMFGAFDWNRLVTCEAGFYEPGLFDIRSGTPRPTALARLVRELARGEEPSHPALHGPRWWRTAPVRVEAAA